MSGKSEHAEYAVEMKGISKRFGSVQALDNVDLRVRRGEVLALLGENGAGKTTLMNILCGLCSPDCGEIIVSGTPVKMSGPVIAHRCGIAMVHQEYVLAENLTVAENLAVGFEPRRGVFLDLQRMREATTRLCEQRVGIDPNATVGTLSMGMRQQVEILKLLYRGAQVLVFDEPTSVLVPQEVERLFESFKRFKEQNKTIIFISHKLREVLACADSIVVLRDGRVVGTMPRSEADQRRLAEMMVGRTVTHTRLEHSSQGGATLLTASGLCVRDDQRTLRLRSVDVLLCAGEIVGVAGVDGNGQTELVETLVGLRKPESGEIRLGDREITGTMHKEFLAAGVGYLPADRDHEGLILDMELWENLLLKHQNKPPFRRRWSLNRKAAKAYADSLIHRFDIKPAVSTVRVKHLSGGNRQKTVVAREINLGNLLVLIAHQPTRGLDIGATEFVHDVLLRLRQEGKGILLVSADLEEVRALSDRIIVLYEGQVTGEGAADQFTEAQLGWLMAGGDTTSKAC